MEQELFDELADSVKEMKAVMRGEQKPSRVFHLPDESRGQTEARFAVCVMTDDAELLTPRRIYQVDFIADLKLMALTDDAGEAAVYPADYFVLIDLPHEVQSAFVQHNLVSTSS
jgi:hypothetical protein